MTIDFSKIPLSKCTIANGFIFVSGQIGLSKQGTLVAGGIAEQTRQAIKNIEVVLKDNDCNLHQVIKTTIWLTDGADFAEFNTTYEECFGPPPFSARSTVISSLLIPGARVEIEAIAFLGLKPNQALNSDGSS